MTTQQEQESNNREVVVVLGVGRSGTSLAMQALETLGIRVSENIIPPNVSNPKGFYEDADIVEIHKQLLNTLTPSPAMPLQEGWINTPQARQALKQLKAIVEAQLGTGKGVWAFKDPRTATFLPLWIRLFNQLKIVPRFVLAMRQPESIIESFAQQYGNDQEFAELIFLQRTLDALYFTGGDCHLLPYENWFTSPQQTLQQLADFVFDQQTDISDKTPPVSAQLKRSRSTGVQVNNPLVRTLYEHLQVCIDEPEQHDALMACVQHQREVLAAFRPWWMLAANQKQANAKCREQLKETTEKNRQLTVCQQQLKRQTAALGQYQQAFRDVERLQQITD